MTAAVDDRIFRTRYFERCGDHVAGELILTADSGKLRVAIDHRGGPRRSVTLDAGQLDGLIDVLPKLREWVASGEPMLVDPSES